MTPHDITWHQMPHVNHAQLGCGLWVSLWKGWGTDLSPCPLGRSPGRRRESGRIISSFSLSLQPWNTAKRLAHCHAYCTYTHAHVRTDTHKTQHTHTHLQSHTLIHAHTHTHTHTQTHTYTHTHTHTHTHTQRERETHTNSHTHRRANARTYPERHPAWLTICDFPLMCDLCLFTWSITSSFTLYSETPDPIQRYSWWWLPWIHSTM